MKRLLNWLAVVALVSACVLAGIGHFRLENLRHDSAEQIQTIQRVTQEALANDRAYAVIESRLYWQANGETREEWTARVARIVSGDEPLAGYICTVLTGCMVHGGTIEVCSPCNSDPPSPQCITNHQADIDAFCAAFSCTDCPPAGR